MGPCLTLESFLDFLEDQERFRRQDWGPSGKEFSAAPLVYLSGSGHDCVRGRGSLLCNHGQRSC